LKNYLSLSGRRGQFNWDEDRLKNYLSLLGGRSDDDSFAIFNDPESLS